MSAYISVLIDGVKTRELFNEDEADSYRDAINDLVDAGWVSDEIHSKVILALISETPET